MTFKEWLLRGGVVLFQAGTSPGGLWNDSRPTAGLDPSNGYGIKVALMWGKLDWPIPKFWKKGAQSNRWVKENQLCHIKTKFPLPGLFLSVSLGNRGFYIGLKESGWGINSVLLPTARFTKQRDI